MNILIHMHVNLMIFLSIVASPFGFGVAGGGANPVGFNARSVMCFVFLLRFVQFILQRQRQRHNFINFNATEVTIAYLE